MTTIKTTIKTKNKRRSKSMRRSNQTRLVPSTMAAIRLLRSRLQTSETTQGFTPSDGGRTTWRLPLPLPVPPALSTTTAAVVVVAAATLAPSLHTETSLQNTP
jgi:hypothetical protein